MGRMDVDSLKKRVIINHHQMVNHQVALRDQVLLVDPMDADQLQITAMESDVAQVDAVP